MNVSYASNAPIYHNGIRDVKLEQECYVNMSQASSCDYSMSQFRPDESSFQVKAEAFNDEDSQFGSYVTNNVQDDQFDPLGLRVVQADPKPDSDIAQNDIVDDDEEDIPIAARKKVKREISDDDEDDIPLTSRKKIKTEKKAKKKKHDQSDYDDADDYDEKPKKKKVKKEKV